MGLNSTRGVFSLEDVALTVEGVVLVYLLFKRCFRKGDVGWHNIKIQLIIGLK